MYYYVLQKSERAIKLLKYSLRDTKYSIGQNTGKEDENDLNNTKQDMNRKLNEHYINEINKSSAILNDIKYARNILVDISKIGGGDIRKNIGGKLKGNMFLYTLSSNGEWIRICSISNQKNVIQSSFKGTQTSNTDVINYDTNTYAENIKINDSQYIQYLLNYLKFLHKYRNSYNSGIGVDNKRGVLSFDDVYIWQMYESRGTDGIYAYVSRKKPNSVEYQHLVYFFTRLKEQPSPRPKLQEMIDSEIKHNIKIIFGNVMNHAKYVLDSLHNEHIIYLLA
jgi:hypothetical protein